MGNYRFKLSDMVPNAWFYKLNDMGKSRSQSRNQIKKKQTSSSSLSSNLSSSLFSSSSNSNLQQTKTQQHHNLSYQRKSYYFSRNLSPYNSQQYSKHPTSNNIINISESPTKSANKRRNTSRRKTSISPKCVNSPFSSSFTTSSSEPESSVHSHKTFDAMIMSAPRRRCNDIVTDMSKNDHIFDSISKMDLPPITTKPKKLQDSTNIGTSPKRRVSMSSSIGVKLRTKSPRIVSRKSVSSIRTSVGEKSFVVVKSSKDPHKDFKESMVEMIVKNNIRTSKDLEDLLACYLSLNSDHYHNLIIKVFKQIWFEIQLR